MSSNEMDPDLHDVLWDGLLDNDIEPNDTSMAEWNAKIPQDIRHLAQMWGWGDTEVRETLYVFIKSNQEKP